MPVTTVEDSKSAPLISARRFVGDLVRHEPRLFAISLVLTVLAALTESLGLLLLVPLVVAAGVVDGADSSLTDSIRPGTPRHIVTHHPAPPRRRSGPDPVRGRRRSEAPAGGSTRRDPLR